MRADPAVVGLSLLLINKYIFSFWVVIPGVFGMPTFMGSFVTLSSDGLCWLWVHCLVKVAHLLATVAAALGPLAVTFPLSQACNSLPAFLLYVLLHHSCFHYNILTLRSLWDLIWAYKMKRYASFLIGFRNDSVYDPFNVSLQGIGRLS